MFQQTAKNIQLFVICAIRVNTCEVSVYTARTFMKCTQKKLISSLANYK